MFLSWPVFLPDSFIDPDEISVGKYRIRNNNYIMFFFIGFC